MLDTPALEEMGLCEFVAQLRRSRIHGTSLSFVHQAYNYLTQHYRNHSAARGKAKSVQIVAQSNLLYELFTTEGKGTYIKLGYSIYEEKTNKLHSFTEVDGLGIAEVETGSQNVDIITNFDVERDHWRQYLPETLMDHILKDHSRFAWVAKQGSPLYEWSDRLVTHLRTQGTHIIETSLPIFNSSESFAYIAGVNPLNSKEYGHVAELLSERVRKQIQSH